MNFISGIRVKKDFAHYTAGTVIPFSDRHGNGCLVVSGVLGKRGGCFDQFCRELNGALFGRSDYLELVAGDASNPGVVLYLDFLCRSPYISCSDPRLEETLRTYGNSRHEMLAFISKLGSPVVSQYSDIDSMVVFINQPSAGTLGWRAYNDISSCGYRNKGQVIIIDSSDDLPKQTAQCFYPSVGSYVYGGAVPKNMSLEASIGIARFTRKKYSDRQQYVVNMERANSSGVDWFVEGNCSKSYFSLFTDILSVTRYTKEHAEVMCEALTKVHQVWSRYVRGGTEGLESYDYSNVTKLRAITLADYFEEKFGGSAAVDFSYRLPAR